MAINPETQYPGKIAPSSPDYPYGAARNITVPGDGTGTPWEAALVNDLFGFQQALLNAAGIVPSGTPEKATASQYKNALDALYVRLAELSPADSQVLIAQVAATIVADNSAFVDVMEWGDGITFEIGDKVRDADNPTNFYRCSREHTVDTAFGPALTDWLDADPPYWEPVDLNDQYQASNRIATHLTQQRNNMVREFNALNKGFLPDSRGVILLGDSHSWGEGADSYEGSFDTDLTNTIHAATITNEGYYTKLARHIREKLGTSNQRAVPFYGDNLVIKDGLATNVKTTFDKVTEMQDIRIISGKFRRLDSLPPADKNNSIFGGARLRGVAYDRDTYRYTPELGAFDASVLQIGPDGVSGPSAAIIDVPNPVNMINLGIVHFRDTGAKVKVEFLSSTMPDDYDISGGVDNIVDPFFTELKIVPYKPGVQGVDVNPERLLTDNSAASMYTINESNRSLIIDTSVTTDVGTASEFYPHVIRTVRKFSGKIRISWDSDGVNFTTNGTFGGSQYYLRGVLLNNNDTLKNWSMGGHSLGAMLGLEPSFFGETKNHINEVVKYTFVDPALLVLQLPFVNEIIKNTSQTDFKNRLQLLIDSIDAKNVILFTTVGAEDKEYPASPSDVARLKMSEYTKAAQEVCDTNPEVSFVDCRRHLLDLVNSGQLLQGELYYNNGHPSPRVNQIVFDFIKSAVDYAL